MRGDPIDDGDIGAAQRGVVNFVTDRHRDQPQAEQRAVRITPDKPFRK